MRRRSRTGTAEDPNLALSVDLLTRFAQEDIHAGGIAHLHLFGGLPVDEAGKDVGMLRAVAYHNGKYARAWLREALDKKREKCETLFFRMEHREWLHSHR